MSNLYDSELYSKLSIDFDQEILDLALTIACKNIISLKTHPNMNGFDQEVDRLKFSLLRRSFKEIHGDT